MTQQKTTTHNVPKLRFPEFQDVGAWDEKRLGSLSQILRGGSPRPIANFLTIDINGLNWLKIGDVNSESKYITQTQEKVIKKALSKTREVQPGDLILSNSMSFGRPYILKIKSCIHDGWIAITKIKNQINRDYLYYLILSPSSQEYFLNNAAGSGVQNLNADIIKLLPVVAPKFPEQQKIANCLSSIDELITAHAQKLDTLNGHKKGLMQQIFPGDGETVPKLRFPEFRYAPEWSNQNIRNFIERSFYGTSRSTSDTGKYPVLRMGNMSDGRIDFSNLAYIDLSKTEFNKLKLKKGDLLLNRTNSFDLVGKISLFDSEIDYLTASYIVTYRLNSEKINPIFCNFVLNTSLYQEKIRALSTKAVNQANINPTVFQDSISIPLPELDEQLKVADFLSSIEELITAQAQKLDTLKAHKKGLIQQLFPSTDEGNG